MRQFVFKCANLIIIAVVLLSYQKYATARADLVAAHEAEEKKAQELEKEYARIVEEAEESLESSSGLKNGIWEATGQGFGGDITLQVSIQDHKITNVEILSAQGEDPEYLSMAENLLSEIVDAQTVDGLDTITGATFSSKGILAAAKQALEEAEP